MRYLLDTHTLIWAATEPEKLSAKVRQIIESPENTLLVSVISFWEISLKSSLGKLQIEGFAPNDLPELCKKMDIGMINLDAFVCSTYHHLPVTEHKDPFDRMLVWQCIQLKLPLISNDKSIKLYLPAGLQVIW